MIDVHYTPASLAEAMLEALPIDFQPATIADFSAGEGALLIQAQRKWRNAVIYANDICQNGACKLLKSNPNWVVSCTDFLSKTSHTDTEFSVHKNGIDLILLNPPFSERRRGRFESDWFSKEKWSAGLATTFVFLSLKYLSKNGCMIAIVPDGSLTSMRDKKGWELISSKHVVEVLKENPVNSFKGAAAKTSIIMIKKRTSNDSVNEVTKFNTSKSERKITVLRGNVQMHKVVTIDAGFKLIHTSNLSLGEVLDENAPMVSKGLRVIGPAILFPRVGQASRQKISILREGCEVVLSDCVLAVVCKSSDSANYLKDKILDKWSEFFKLYRGTGAPYITIERASLFLNSLT
ncbi:N-6 DNA methylase [Rheinheimera oceanensis]|uniref:N-6 DNA methylase n=1 Tax=Rheinheimera oceanensis TaxID=2817449 RepID=UPI001BFCDBA4|nr:N-6 DNA methylase [Rheinheimera oceanensis]